MRITINRQHIQSQQTMNCGNEDNIEDIVLESIFRDIDSEDIFSALDKSEELFSSIQLADVFYKYAEDHRVIFNQKEFVSFIATHIDGVACNRYMLQSNRKRYRGSDENKHEWFRNGIGWRIISGFYGYSVFYELEKATEALKKTSNLSRCICPMRVIDVNDRIYRIYDIEEDMRLPGCRWTKIQKNAFCLWKDAGEPISDGQEFWTRAEAELIEREGVFDFNEEMQ
jgi:hypothetical protein